MVRYGEERLKVGLQFRWRPPEVSLQVEQVAELGKMGVKKKRCRTSKKEKCLVMMIKVSRQTWTKLRASSASISCQLCSYSDVLKHCLPQRRARRYKEIDAARPSRSGVPLRSRLASQPWTYLHTVTVFPSFDSLCGIKRRHVYLFCICVSEWCLSALVRRTAALCSEATT